MQLLAEQDVLILSVKFAVAIVAGFVAGFVNTLAGNGSAITLPTLMFLGLDASAANATNRVGILLSSFTSSMTFRQRGLLKLKGIYWLVAPVVVGSMVGACIAGVLDKDSMKLAIGVVMVIMLAMVLFQPSRWLREDSGKDKDHKSIKSAVIFFTIGAYAGFVQAGAGILLLSALVLGAKYSLARANPVKVVLIFSITLLALVVFICQGQVHWWYGLLMAVGQVPGAWSAARFAASHPRANVWIRRLLILVIIGVLFRLFGAYDYLVSLTASGHGGA